MATSTIYDKQIDSKLEAIRTVIDSSIKQLEAISPQTIKASKYASCSSLFDIARRSLQTARTRVGDVITAGKFA